MLYNQIENYKLSKKIKKYEKSPLEKGTLQSNITEL